MKTKRFEVLLEPEEYQALARIAIHESMRKQVQVSRAEWIREQIVKGAKKRRVWK